MLSTRDLEQRVAERTAALGESEGRLAGVIQSAMDAIITVDDEQRILLFNARRRKNVPLPRRGSTGAAHHSFHSAALPRAPMPDTSTSSAIPESPAGPWGEDMRCGRFAPMARNFRLRPPSRKWSRGGKKLFTVILRDVTERVQAEAVREHLAAIVDSSDDAIISKDLNGTINAWNRGAEKIFGYSAAEAVGKPMVMLFPRGRVNEEADILDRIRRGESVEHFETVRVRKDGTND